MGLVVRLGGGSRDRETEPRMKDPSPWLTGHRSLLPVAGESLDLACGSGRHAIWLAEQGFRTMAVDRDSVAIDTLSQEAARRGLETKTLPFRGDLDLLAAARLRRLLQRERPDLVHFHSLRAHVVGAPAARLAGMRGIVATRRMDYRISRHPLNRLAFARCTDLVIAISEAVRDALLAFGLPA